MTGSVDKAIIKKSEIHGSYPASEHPDEARELGVDLGGDLWLLNISKNEATARKLSYVVVNGGLWVATLGIIAAGIAYGISR